MEDYSKLLNLIGLPQEEQNMTPELDYSEQMSIDPSLSMAQPSSVEMDPIQEEIVNAVAGEELPKPEIVKSKKEEMPKNIIKEAESKIEEPNNEISELDKKQESIESRRMWGNMLDNIAKAISASSSARSGIASKPVGFDTSFINKIAEEQLKGIDKKRQDILKKEKDQFSNAELKMYQDLGISIPEGMTPSQFRKASGLIQQKMKADENQKDREYKKQLYADKKAIKAKQKPMSKKQIAVDNNFAKEYSKWISGDNVTAKTQIGKLEEVSKKLEDASKSSTSALSGRVVGNLPKQMRTDESLEVQQDVESAVIGALRATLGAQFTEKEGERVLAQSYDPMLSEEANLKKVKRIVKDLKDRYKEKATAVDHFERHDTLAGFKADKMDEIITPASKNQDPKIKEYAEKYNLDYNKAEMILRNRGYGK